MRWSQLKPGDVLVPCRRLDVNLIVLLASFGKTEFVTVKVLEICTWRSLRVPSYNVHVDKEASGYDVIHADGTVSV